MRFLSVSFISAIIAYVAPVSAADISVQSLIKSVIIYPDGAQISRNMDIDIPAGNSRLIIGNLPSSIDPNSLRIEGTGNSALSILSLDTRLVAANPNTSADPALSVKIGVLKAERDAVQGKIEAAELQKITVQNYAEAAPKSIHNNDKAIDPADWAKGWTAVSDGMMKVNEQLLILRTQIKRLDDEIVALNRTKPIEPKATAPLFEAQIVVDAPSALKANLKLIYQVRGANWMPTYDAKLAIEGLDKPKLTLTRRAIIAQQTGEDWQDVIVQLSTVKLQRLTAAPLVATSTLNLVDPVIVQEQFLQKNAITTAPAPTGRMRVYSAEDADKIKREDAPVVVKEVMANVEAGAYQASFIVPNTLNVSKDGTQKTFTLGSQTIEPELTLKSAPSLDAAAYLEASFINTEDAPLLAGQVMIHRDGTYVGRDSLKLIAAGDKASLGFGVDDSVKITRAPVKKRENDAGFWGNTRTNLQDFKTSAKNLHKFTVKLTIIDRIPISENTALIVEPLNTNTPPTEKIVDDQRGVMSWSYELKPAEMREIRLGWRVKWPADRDVISTSKMR